MTSKAIDSRLSLYGLSRNICFIL